MKIITVTILVVQALLWSANSFAGWYYDVKVKYLYAGDVGNRYSIQLVGLSPNPDNCPSTHDLFIDETSPKFKQIWSLLLTSHVSDKPVGIYLSGCGDLLNLPKVTDVLIGSNQ